MAKWIGHFLILRKIKNLGNDTSHPAVFKIRMQGWGLLGNFKNRECSLPQRLGHHTTQRRQWVPIVLHREDLQSHRTTDFTPMAWDRNKKEKNCLVENFERKRSYHSPNALSSQWYPRWELTCAVRTKFRQNQQNSHLLESSQILVLRSRAPPLSKSF